MGKQWKTAGKQAQAHLKGALFTRLAREIQVASRLTGGDRSHPRLQAALNQARLHSMPKNTIERAVAKGQGTGDQENLQELLYEGFGPFGLALIIKALTENHTRTAADIRFLFKSEGGSLGESGSVRWMFEEVSFLKACPPKTFNVAGGVDGEQTALDIGALNISPLNPSDQSFCFYGEKNDLKKLHTALVQKQWTVLEAVLSYRAKNFLSLAGDEHHQAVKIISSFQRHTDIHLVCHNLKS